MPSQESLHDASNGVGLAVDLVNLTGAPAIPANVWAFPTSNFSPTNGTVLVQLQGSNDDVGNPPAWTNIGSASSINSTAPVQLNGGAIPYQRVRAVFVAAPFGAPPARGTLTVIVSS